MINFFIHTPTQYVSVSCRCTSRGGFRRHGQVVGGWRPTTRPTSSPSPASSPVTHPHQLPPRVRGQRAQQRCVGMGVEGQTKGSSSADCFRSLEQEVTWLCVDMCGCVVVSRRWGHRTRRRTTRSDNESTDTTTQKGIGEYRMLCCGYI
jgi:hypothetical protein